MAKLYVVRLEMSLTSRQISAETREEALALARQKLPDDGFWESSIPYHGLQVSEVDSDGDPHQQSHSCDG
jgi:hypothetical protein